MSAASNSKSTIRVMVFCSLFCFILRNLLITNLLYTLVNTLFVRFYWCNIQVCKSTHCREEHLTKKLSSQLNVKVVNEDTLIVCY